MRSIKNWLSWPIAATCLCGFSVAPACADTPTITYESAIVTETLPAGGRAPAVVYYAADTAEPFMQLAVDTEIRQLRSACRAGVNWVVILNSWVVNRDPFVACVDGAIRQINPPYEALAGIIDAAADPNFEPRQAPGLLQYHVEVTPENRPYRHLYARYPLVHADVMAEVLQFVVRDVFSTSEHEIFLHLKAHGTSHLAMTALDEETLTERVETQREAWVEYAQERGWDVSLPALLPGEQGRGDVPPLPTGVVDAAGLGRIPAGGLGAAAHALPGHLGAIQLGLSDDSSLANYFGLSIEQLNLVALRIASGRPLSGFTMIEACDSRIRSNLDMRTILSMGRTGHAAFYSAMGTLWYRNIDWDEMLVSIPFQGAARDLQYRLADVAAGIPNFHYPLRNE